MHIKIHEAKILQFYTEQAAEHPSQKLTLRVNHIKDVVRHGETIANNIGLDTYGKDIMKITTYLHDYYQVLQIAGGAPDPHLHHSAPEALERVLFGNNQIDEYADGLTTFDKNVIKTAIEQHAKIAVELPTDAGPLLVLFCNILRDADKSAIFELIKEPLYVLRNDWGFSDEQITNSISKDGGTTGVNPKVLEDFLKGQSVLNADIKTPADWAISMLGYLWNVQTEIALQSILESAKTFIDNLPFPAEVNNTVRGCYYHVLNNLIVLRK